MSAFKILADLDAARLRESGLLSDSDSFGTPSPEAAGSQRIHKRRLNNSSDKENEDIALNITPESEAGRDAFATIPVVLFSYETLIYVGFSREKATELWNRWSNWPTDGPRREIDPEDGGMIITFKDIIIHSIDKHADTADDDDTKWRTCLRACGIANDVQDAIMDPHFRHLRRQESCLFWVSDTLRMRYAGLLDIQRTSRAREMQLRRGAARPSDSRGGSGQSGRPSGSNVATGSSSSASQDRRSVSALQRETAPGFGPGTWNAASAAAASHAPGHTVLFKAMDQARIIGLFDEGGSLVDIEKLRSRAPSDFEGTRPRYYFTTDYKVAEVYAAYAKRRVECESVVIICIQVPNAAIRSLVAPEILHISWPADEWKELIWRCRKGKSRVPANLQKYQDATLVIGTIAGKPNIVYEAMESWQQVTERHLLRVEARQNRPATQYVFTDANKGADFLLENGARQMRVFGYPQKELEAWLAANPA